MRLARLAAADWDRIAIIAIVVGVLIRAAWVLALHPPLEHVYSDMDGYVARAVKLAQGAPLDRYDAFYPPGTHWILAVPFAVFGIDRTGLWAGALLWWAFSAFTPLAMWRFARYYLSVPAAALTAVLVALYPIHIAYSGFFLSETPALALLVASLWLAARAASRDRSGGVLRAGLIGGLAVANRPALIANLIVAALSLPRRAKLGAAIALGAGAAVVLGLVVLHNTLAAGRLAFISENSALTFWLGHCDVRSVKAGNPNGGPYFEFAAPPALERGSGRDFVIPDHLAWDQDYFYAQAFDCIRRDGAAHLRTLARGVLDMTLTSTPWPMAEEPDLGARTAFVNALFSAALPFILVGAVWLIRERRRRGEPAGEAVMLAHFACVLVTALLFFGDPRFREPYDVFALALAGALLAHVFVERESLTHETAVGMAG